MNKKKVKEYRSFVTFYISGEQLDPDEITKITGVKPNTKGKKGIYSDGNLGPRMKGKRGYWSIRSDSKEKTFNEQISELAKKVKPVKNKFIKTLKDNSSIEKLYLEIVIEPSSSNIVSGYELQPKEIEFWTSLGASIAFSFWLP